MKDKILAFDVNYTVENMLKRSKTVLNPKIYQSNRVNLIRKIAWNENCFYDHKKNQLFVDEFEKTKESEEVRKKSTAQIKTNILFELWKDKLYNDLIIIKQLTSSELCKILGIDKSESNRVNLETTIQNLHTEA